MPVKTEGSVRRLVKATEIDDRCRSVVERSATFLERFHRFRGRGGGRGRCEALRIFR